MQMFAEDAAIDCGELAGRHKSGESSGARAGFPVVGELPAEPVAAQSNDGVGSADGPEHPRLLEPGSDQRLASFLIPVAEVHIQDGETLENALFFSTDSVADAPAQCYNSGDA